MMKRMGFCAKWIKWIEGVNGSPIEEFCPHRGLRQGDPLVPFLFNIVVEGLSGLMREVQEQKLFERIKIRKDEVDISLF